MLRLCDFEHLLKRRKVQDEGAVRRSRKYMPQKLVHASFSGFSSSSHPRGVQIVLA